MVRSDDNDDGASRNNDKLSKNLVYRNAALPRRIGVNEKFAIFLKYRPLSRGARLTTGKN